MSWEPGVRDERNPAMKHRNPAMKHRWRFKRRGENPRGAKRWPRRSRGINLLGWRTQRLLTPAELFIGSFLSLTILGTLGLKMLPGLYRQDPLSWSDAAFTATSAVCVTGLIVVDTSTHFTLAGQFYLLLLIQLGGLGMLTLTSVIITALGGRPSLRSETITTGVKRVMPNVSARRLILDVVRFTLLIEAAGAILLYLIWAPRLGWREAVWPSIFHSISGFCNAGFSTNADSLVRFQDSPTTILTITALVIAGGLGFVTMEELLQVVRRKPKRRLQRLSIHSRLVLLTSAALLVVGWALFALFEWRGVLSDMPLTDKLSNALFMSVTPRTAGFNTIDYQAASDSTNFLTVLLMMIGGSPGSTAGGMKTTTFALIGLLAWSRLRARQTVIFAGRSIPDETIQRAVGLFVIATGVVLAGIFAVASVEEFIGRESDFLMSMFEVVSAFNTVGLSMGVTSELSAPSRWILVVLMFVGRTGPLSLAAALVVRLSQQGRFRLAYEDVNVG